MKENNIKRGIALALSTLFLFVLAFLCQLAKRALPFLLTAALAGGLSAGWGEEKPDQPAPPAEAVGDWQEQYDLGVRFLSEGNYEEAILAFTAAIEIEPRRPELYSSRAQAYVLSGETDANLSAARSDYETALDLDDTMVDSWLGLADVYIRQGDVDKALEVLEQGLDKTGEDSEISDKIAEIQGGTVTDSSGRVRRESTYDGDGVLIWYHTYTYDPDGQQIAVTSFDAAGIQTGHVDTVDDPDGNVLISYYWYTDTGEVGKIERILDDRGREIESIHYTLEGEIDTTTRSFYGSDGTLEREEWYDAYGDLMWYRTYEYDAQGRNIRDSDYTADGILSNYYTREYGENGRIESYCHYDADGTLTQREVYLYDEQGNNIGSEHYDGDGNLIQSTVME